MPWQQSDLDYKDWQSFKQANPKKPASTASILKWALAGLLLAIILVSIFDSWSKSDKMVKKEKAEHPRITGPVYFEASKTVTEGIPNTVVFTYDVSNVVADSFYIQQSWNPHNRVAINPTGSALTSIYYESGFHRARLMANDSVIAQQPVHILSNGWEPHLYYSDADRPIDFKNESFVADGQLHLDSTMLAKRNIDYSKRFHSRISNSQIFNVHSDNFSFFTRMKVDGVHDELCPWVAIIIVTEVHVFRVVLQDKGCEKYARYKLGEIEKSGHDNDLSSLGCNTKEWQELEVLVKDKHASIYLNHKLTYEEVFNENLGKVVGLVYAFDGTGSIDYARLNNGDGQIVFEDDFKK